MTDRARDLSLRAADAAARRAARAREAGDDARRSTATSGARSSRCCVLFVPVTFFWAAYEQQGNTIALWADALHRSQLCSRLFTIPVTWFQSFNPFMIFAFTPFLIALWARQATRGSEPSTVDQDGDRLLRRGARQPRHGRRRRHAGDRQASWLWLFAYFVVLTIGELYLSPIALSLVTKVAPARIVSMMMGVWLATSFTGNLVAGYLGSFWSSMGKSDFFLMIAIVAALAGVAVLAVASPVNPVLRQR